MNLKLRDFVLVGLQFVLFAVYFLDFNVLQVRDLGFISRIGFVITICGVVLFFIALLQLNTSLSPFPTPKKDGFLVKNGLYSFMRHPIYTGILFAVFGFAIHLGSVYKIFIGILLFLLFDVKVRYEEQMLRRKYKEDYESYMEHTGRFLPK